MKPTQLRKVTLVALEQVHFVFESLLMLKPHMKPIMNNQQLNYMIKFFNGFEQAEQEMRKFVVDPLLQYSLKDHIDIFSDIHHLNWMLPSVKTQQSSFVEKVMRLAKKDIVKKQVWDVDHLGEMPASLVKFFSDTI